MSKKILFCLHPNPNFNHRRPKGPDNPQNFWRRVGVGFANEKADDGSVNIYLDNQPGVTYQLRDEEPQDEVQTDPDAIRDPGEEG